MKKVSARGCLFATCCILVTNPYINDAIGKENSEAHDDHRVRIRVSSKHLCVVSTYFKSMLRSGMTESSKLVSLRHVELTLSELDPDAVLIIMNAIHSRLRRLPISADLGMLTQLAIAVDFVQCHEAVERFARDWIKKLKMEVPTLHSAELVQWLCVSKVFGDSKLFKTVTLTMIRQARGQIQDLHLPIGERIIGERFLETL